MFINNVGANTELEKNKHFYNSRLGGSRVACDPDVIPKGLPHGGCLVLKFSVTTG